MFERLVDGSWTGAIGRRRHRRPAHGGRRATRRLERTAQRASGAPPHACGNRGDEDDSQQGAWMIQTGAAARTSRGPVRACSVQRIATTGGGRGLRRLAVRARRSATGADAGRPKEVLLSDDPPDGRAQGAQGAAGARGARVSYPNGTADRRVPRTGGHCAVAARPERARNNGCDQTLDGQRRCWTRYAAASRCCARSGCECAGNRRRRARPRGLRSKAMQTTERAADGAGPLPDAASHEAETWPSCCCRRQRFDRRLDLG